MFGDLIRLSRPKHWIKNIFVFLPVPFALAAGAHLDPVVFLSGLLSLCLASSAVYAINDAADAERDRMHEDKRHRPIAAGRISKTTAHVWAAVLVAAGIGLTYVAGGGFVLVLFAGYIAINLVYSFGAKHVALVDVFLLSSLYLIRVLLGCALLAVPASNWLLLCSGALALFVALAKRRADVIKGLDATHRPALLGYNKEFLDQAIGISASMTIVAYAMYSMDAGTSHSLIKQGREFAPLPFVVFGVLDYLRMAHVQGAGGSPVDMLLRSPTLLLSGVGWLAAVVWSLSWM